MITINPFDARKIMEKIGKSMIFKVENLKAVEGYRAEQPLFITAMWGVCRKKNGIYMSPLLTVSDVSSLEEIFCHNAAASFFFWWTFVVTATLIALIPIFNNVGLSETGATSIFVLINGPLFLIYNWQMYLFSSKARKAGDKLWERGANVIVPSGCRKKVFVRTLKLWAGPFGAAVLSEVVNLTADDEMKLVHNGLKLGEEVIKFVKNESDSQGGRYL